MTDFNLSALHAAAVTDAATIAFGGTDVKVALSPDRDKFIVHAHEADAGRMKLVPGQRHNRGGQFWECPATRGQAAALSLIFDGRLDPSEEAKRHVARMFMPTKHDVPELNEKLFPYQREGVNFLLSTADGALLTDEMGLGKTVQAIEWMRMLTYGNPSLVVCTNSMKFKWAEEIEAWWPDVRVVVIDGTARQRAQQIEELAESGDVGVINYESARSESRLLPYGGKRLTDKQKEPKALNGLNFSCVVLDEAHKIKDPKSQQTLAVKALGGQALYRLAMTGTPLLNDPDDCWSIMNFLAPAEWGSISQFRDLYCDVREAWHGGFVNNGLLGGENRRSFDTVFYPRHLRRLKVNVLPDLPEKFPIDYRLLPMTGRQQSAYNALVKDMMVMIDGGLLTAENPLTELIRLRQAACALPVVDEEGQVTGFQKPSNKLDALVDILQEGGDDPLVIYADSRKFIEFVADRLVKEKYEVGLVTGAQGAKVRERSVREFQEGKIQVLLGTLGAGAEGLTLTRANRIVLAQQSWSHATNAQAIDRVHRIGQTRGVQPIVLLSKDTVDVAVRKADAIKEGRLQDLVRDRAWFEAALRGE